jgi:hypothetical protein
MRVCEAANAKIDLTRIGFGHGDDGAGNAGLATSTSGEAPVSVTPAKSLAGSSVTVLR